MKVLHREYVSGFGFLGKHVAVEIILSLPETGGRYELAIKYGKQGGVTETYKYADVDFCIIVFRMLLTYNRQLKVSEDAAYASVYSSLLQFGSYDKVDPNLVNALGLEPFEVINQPFEGWEEEVINEQALAGNFDLHAVSILVDHGMLKLREELESKLAEAMADFESWLDATGLNNLFDLLEPSEVFSIFATERAALIRTSFVIWDKGEEIHANQSSHVIALAVLIRCNSAVSFHGSKQNLKSKANSLGILMMLPFVWSSYDLPGDQNIDQIVQETLDFLDLLKQSSEL